MFGWFRKAERIKGKAFENSRDRVREYITDPKAGRRVLHELEPLFGSSLGRTAKAAWWQRMAAWFFPALRRDMGDISLKYRVLIRSFQVREFRSQLSRRHGEIAKQMEGLSTWRVRLRRALAFRHEMSAQYDGLVVQLKELANRLDKLKRLSRSWRRKEKDRLVRSYFNPRIRYAYHPQDAKRNVDFLRGLREELVDLQLQEVDKKLKSLSIGGKDLVGVLEALETGAAGLKKKIASLEKSGLAKGLGASERYQGLALKERGERLMADYAGLSDKVKKLLEELKQKEGKHFEKRERLLRHQFEGLEKRRRPLERSIQSFHEKVKGLTKEDRQVNEQASHLALCFLLDQTLAPDHPHLEQLAKGEVPAVGESLKADQAFRFFTQWVGKQAVSSQVSSVMLRDYLYLVRDYQQDLLQVYNSVHDANLIYLRQIAGALGKEMPPHIPELEKRLATQTGLNVFVENAGREIVEDAFSSRREEEQDKWRALMEALIPDEMTYSNWTRRSA